MHSNNDSFVRWFDDPLAPPPQFSSTQNPKQLKTRKNRGEAEKLWQRGLSGYPTSHTQPPQRVVASPHSSATKAQIIICWHLFAHKERICTR